MNCPWRVVFDVRSQGFPFGDLLIPGLLLVAAVGGLYTVRRRGWPKAETAFAAVFFVMTTVIVAPATVAVIGRWFHVHSAAGHALVVEGIVSEFHAMPYTGHDTDHFVLGGVRFSYTDFEVTPGFHRTVSHGGPIDEGSRIRLHYLPDRPDPTITRVELPRC